MSWTIRHAGSPRAVEGLTTAQVVEGLQEGHWDPTDEIRGDRDPEWVALESHPQFEEVAAELEPTPPKHYDDETRLDMNPLIDVCLVLLIFFILTTSYAALQRFLESPGGTTQKLKGPPVMTKEKLESTTIKVEALRENGRTVIRVEDEIVDPEDLVAALRRYVKKKSTLWLHVADDVKYGTEIQIRDAAKGAGVQRVLVQVDDPNQPAKGP